MSDRGILFLFSLVVLMASLAAAAWLVISGQAGSVDGLFLLLTSLLVAFAFGCYLLFLVRRARASLVPAPEAVKKAGAAPPKAAPKAATSSQPVETS